MILGMLDWQFAVLVCMCVVFIVSLVVIILLFRWLRPVKRRGGRHGSSADIQPSALVSSPHAGDAPSSDATLHFVDFDQHMRTVSLQGGATFGGVSTAIHSGRELQKLIAALCNIPDWKTLGLIRYARNRLDGPTWVDLDYLLTRDRNFVARIQSTRFAPLHLARTSADASPHGSTGGGHTTHSGAVDAAASPRNSCAASTLSTVMDATGRRMMRSSSSSPASFLVPAQTAYSVMNEGGVHDHRPYHPHGVGGVGGGDRGANDASDARTHASATASPSVAPHHHSRVPTPLFFPTATHIRAGTPIFILAAHYYYRDRRPEECLDESTSALLEAAMCGDTPSHSVHLVCGKLEGSTIRVSPEKGTAVVRKRGMADEILIRRSADHIRFGINPGNAVQWSQFTQPFCLPPGRWCVYAKATMNNELEFATNAKVYTVESV